MSLLIGFVGLARFSAHALVAAPAGMAPVGRLEKYVHDHWRRMIEWWDSGADVDPSAGFR